MDRSNEGINIDPEYYANTFRLEYPNVDARMSLYEVLNTLGEMGLLGPGFDAEDYDVAPLRMRRKG
ncbi:hypothetical protein UFOVP621_88 [uncultured Caudovirales phage]|uniref:Uncharacterized protein n=1 Tax=uncultured Caudovirales phage TaxID=2100421 RepID=A0A6J5N3M1_9CAUD|nr:hypothetical protein UFOVP621_88 [uncultured Caudovirales phage]